MVQEHFYALYIIIWIQIFLQHRGEIKKTSLPSDFLFELPLFEVSILVVVRAWGRDTYLIRIDRRVTETEMEGNQSWTGLPKSILNLRWSLKNPALELMHRLVHSHRNTMQFLKKFLSCPLFSFFFFFSSSVEQLFHWCSCFILNRLLT